MKILFVGNYKQDFTHTNFYRGKAIRDFGHDLVFFEGRDYILPGRIRDRISFLQKWDFGRLNKKLVRLALNEKPDLCLVIGDRLTLPLPETLIQIRKAGSGIALWVTDLPYGHTFPFIKKAATYYDRVFCAGTEAIELLKNEGFKDPIWLPFGCDSDYHCPVKLNDEEIKTYGKDIVFVGSYYPNRWNVFKELKEFNLGIWGPGWEKALRNRYENISINDGRIDVSEWVKIYSGAKIVIIIHYQDDKTPCYQASPKVYEALACGCFVLVDRQKDVFALFEDKKHLVGFDNVNDLKGKIQYYLANPADRREIADNGRREVLSKHTYRHRIEAILETLLQIKT
ncbi:MAG: glycosyltransferase [Desulfobacterales bacterium]|uniref:Glycosyltransferase n=1 Tax=Candidatus Desulfatibia vada TaxID=2841696 RepID=A0A8J6TQW9_9BACT|nr:glycosyltransferase [Candidatus Desulfatibia vada]